MIEQSDRDAANAYAVDHRMAHLNDGHQLIKAFAAHRTAAEQRGYDRAIAEVCAWLREEHERRMPRDNYAAVFANRIEARQHQKGPQ